MSRDHNNTKIVNVQNESVDDSLTGSFIFGENNLFFTGKMNKTR